MTKVILDETAVSKIADDSILFPGTSAVLIYFSRSYLQKPDGQIIEYGDGFSLQFSPAEKLNNYVDTGSHIYKQEMEDIVDCFIHIPVEWLRDFCHIRITYSDARFRCHKRQLRFNPDQRRRASKD